MSTTALDQAKETIRALFNLAANDAAAQGEIDNALRFAQRLMSAYHLSEEDLGADEDSWKMADEPTTTAGRNVSSWESSLTRWVCSYIGSIGGYCDSPQIVRNEYGFVEISKSGKPIYRCPVHFYGLEEDARLGVDLFNQASLTVMAAARLRFGGVFRGPGRSYADGFVASLHESLARTKETDSGDSTTCALVAKTTAIVTRKREAARRWLAVERGIQLETVSRRRASYYHEAYREGQTDGSKANISASRHKRLPVPERRLPR